MNVAQQIVSVVTEAGVHLIFPLVSRTHLSIDYYLHEVHLSFNFKITSSGTNSTFASGATNERGCLQHNYELKAKSQLYVNFLFSSEITIFSAKKINFLT